MKKISLYIGADHAGFLLKKPLISFLEKSGYSVIDCGAAELTLDDDFTPIALRLAVLVSEHEHALGILLCGSGQGMCVAANKVKGIRAAVAWNEESARVSRHDDHVTVLCLPARFVSGARAQKIVRAWLSEKPGTAKKYARRIAAIHAYEKK